MRLRSREATSFRLASAGEQPVVPKLIGESSKPGAPKGLSNGVSGLAFMGQFLKVVLKLLFAVAVYQNRYGISPTQAVFAHHVGGHQHQVIFRERGLQDELPHWLWELSRSG